ASGTGKSSLVRAGVVPELLGAPGSRWAHVHVEPGRDPLGALEAALAAVEDPERPRLLVVDPLERILEHGDDPTLLRAFAQRVWSLALDHRGSGCLLVLRSQHLGRLRERLRGEPSGPLDTWLDTWLDDERHRIEVSPMSEPQLRAAITEPARRGGLDPSPGLIERIVADVGREPGGGPLMQHALDRLWQARRGQALSVEAYARLGGLIGALEPHASATLASLSAPERAHARRVLTELVHLADDGAASARRRVPVEQLWLGEPHEREATEAVLGRLMDARLVVGAEHPEGGATVELAHEALVRHWPPLLEWLGQERERRIGRYRVLERLHEGGPERDRGRAFLVHDPELDRRVQLVLLEARRGTAEERSRLRERARALARLSHPSAQLVHDVGLARGCVYMTLEPLEGETLTAWLEREPRAWLEIIRVMSSIASALEAMHELGLVHHAVGPDAVWIDAKGVARLVGPSPSPGPEASPARDVTELCTLLHRLLYGEPGSAAPEPEPVGRERPPPSLRDVLLRGLASTPEPRPSMAELRAELQRATEPRTADEAPPPPEPPARGSGRVHLERPGGVVSSTSAFYVSRPELEDPCLREIVEPGALLRIKGPQRMGKTTLLTRILERPRSEGWRIAAIDLQLLDAGILSDLDRFLRGLCAMITRRLKLPRVEDAWDDIFGPKDNCTAFFEDHLLGDAGPLLLALNHVDRLFDSVDVADEFMALLRAWHEMARSQPPWDELRMVLVYSTEMYLPLDINHSPFNVGLAVSMEDWDAGIVSELARRHGLDWTRREIDELMALLGGHPHLVRLALHAIAERGLEPSQALSSAASDEGLFGEHLKKLLWRLQGQPALHEAAVEVMQASGPVRLSTELAFKLVSLGVARMQGNEVVPGRELYRRYLRERLGPARAGG
ncbi:MAG: AAA-like domain-containing protein, partial [Myxococcales bacterium]|nr:AAA-like domain-containing protein [Myxococcales bacterium]